nr:MAG: hypothetical protein [Marsupenaeus japonicus pemonivirus]
MASHGSKKTGNGGVVEGCNVRYNLRPRHGRKTPKTETPTHKVYASISLGENCVCRGKIKDMAMKHSDLRIVTHSMSTAEPTELPQLHPAMAQLSAARVSAMFSFYEVCQCKKTSTAGSQAPTAGPQSPTVSTAAGPQASTAGPKVPTATVPQASTAGPKTIKMRTGPQASTAGPKTIKIKQPGPLPEEQLAYKRLKDALHRCNTLKSRTREIISENEIAMADLNAAIDRYSQFDSRLKSQVPETGPKIVDE